MTVARSYVSIEGESSMATGTLEQMAVPVQNEDAAIRVAELLRNRLDRDRPSSTRLIGGGDHQ
jgi:hypothetical protein